MAPLLSHEAVCEGAISLGFTACGIAPAASVSPLAARRYRQWLEHGGHADMQYLAEHVDMRLDPTLLLPGARSVIVVAMSYAPAHRLPAGEYQLSAYAYGQDYHNVIKGRLRQLVQRLSLQSDEVKIATDTVPLLERYWARQAGLGFIGRNHQLIIPHAGSMFFLGEIVTILPADRYDRPQPNRCGRCRRCLDACPTAALGPDGLAARRCLAYQTIEHRGALDPDVAPRLAPTIFGCDRCQEACPWNRLATPTTIPEFQPSPRLLAMRRADWHALTIEDYRILFRGSAVKRAKYEGLMRNIHAVEQAMEAE